MKANLISRTLRSAALIVLLAAAAVSCSTQDSVARAQAKAEQAVIDSIVAVKAFDALRAQNFVLEADQLVFKRGQTAFVTSLTNFISLTDGKAVVQVAPFNAGGPNGVGGVTVEGRASNVELKIDGKGNARLHMSVLGLGISATVDITLPAGASRASAVISPNFNSQRITLNGNIVSPDDSNVFKGRTL
jgi:hypothetical protein